MYERQENGPVIVNGQRLGENHRLIDATGRTGRISLDLCFYLYQWNLESIFIIGFLYKISKI